MGKGKLKVNAIWATRAPLPGHQKPPHHQNRLIPPHNPHQTPPAFHAAFTYSSSLSENWTLRLASG